MDGRGKLVHRFEAQYELSGRGSVRADRRLLFVVIRDNKDFPEASQWEQTRRNFQKPVTCAG